MNLMNIINKNHDDKTSRGLKDIEKEASKLVNEISEEKMKTESQIKQLIDVLDFSYEDAEEQINNSVFELNTKKDYFISTLNLKLISASTSLKSSIDTFEESSEWIKTQYQNYILR